MAEFNWLWLIICGLADVPNPSLLRTKQTLSNLINRGHIFCKYRHKQTWYDMNLYRGMLIEDSWRVCEVYWLGCDSIGVHQRWTRLSLQGHAQITANDSLPAELRRSRGSLAGRWTVFLLIKPHQSHLPLPRGKFGCVGAPASQHLLTDVI